MVRITRVTTSALFICLAAPAGAQSDSVVRAELLVRLESATAPLVRQFDSLELALRPLAGTRAADSIVRERRAPLARLLGSLERAFSDSVFVIAVYPDGALAQARRRGQRAQADSSERARGDSLVRFLQNRGVFIMRAEGGVYVHLSEQEIHRRAGPYVTPAYREYLRFHAEEEDKPTTGDASIMRTWDELARRLAAHESWAASNRDYPEHAEIAGASRVFLRIFIRGTENTPVFEFRTRTIPPGLRETYRRYAAEHADSPSGKLVAEYLTALSADGWRAGPQVRAFYARHDAILSWRQ